MADNSGLLAVASCVEAAVKAAVQAGAPRRTVAATAAAVASAALAHWKSSNGLQECTVGPAAAGRTLRAVRSAQRKRKKVRKQAAKEAAAANEAVGKSTSDRSRDKGESMAVRSDGADDRLAALHEDEQGQHEEERMSRNKQESMTGRSELSLNDDSWIGTRRSEEENMDDAEEEAAQAATTHGTSSRTPGHKGKGKSKWKKKPEQARG